MCGGWESYKGRRRVPQRLKPRPFKAVADWSLALSAGQLIARDLQSVQVPERGYGDGFGLEELLGESL